MTFKAFLGGVLSAGLLSAMPAQADEEPCNDIPAYVTPEQRIDPNLCSVLKTTAAADFLSISISLKRTPSHTDPVDPKKDTSKPIGPKPDTSTPPDLIEPTKRLFSTYDLRDLAQPAQRLAVPEKYQGTYTVAATKQTIYQISRESYILSIVHWDSRPAGAGIKSLRPGKQVLQKKKPFNLNGRRLEEINTAGHFKLF